MDQTKEELEIALARIRELEKLLEEASLDSLTGLPRRGQFKHRVEEEFSMSGRFGIHFSILVADLNELKKVNDQYGHPAGDMMIASFARVFKNLMREYDIVARIGGDEFMALLPGQDLHGALAVKKKLVSGFENNKKLIPYFSGVAIGVASTEENILTFEMLYQAADARLYVHKAEIKESV